MSVRGFWMFGSCFRWNDFVWSQIWRPSSNWCFALLGLSELIDTIPTTNSRKLEFMESVSPFTHAFIISGKRGKLFGHELSQEFVAEQTQKKGQKWARVCHVCDLWLIYLFTVVLCSVQQLCSFGILERTDEDRAIEMRGWFLYCIAEYSLLVWRFC